MAEITKPVMVYYCACGNSIECATDPELLIGDTKNARALRKDFKQAKQWGRKIETIPLSQFHTIPFNQCSPKIN